MQAQANILERITRAYVAHRGVRLLGVLLVLSAALLLFVFSGGLPPTAWLLLARALPQTSALIAAHGQGVLLALLGLILIAISVPVAWWLLIWLSWRMLAYELYERQEMRAFAADLVEAQYQAEDAIEDAEPIPCDEEEKEEEEDMYQYTRSAIVSRRTRPVARRKVIYPLTSPEPEEQSDDAYQTRPQQSAWEEQQGASNFVDETPAQDSWWDGEIKEEEEQPQGREDLLYASGKRGFVNVAPALAPGAVSASGKSAASVHGVPPLAPGTAPIPGKHAPVNGASALVPGAASASGKSASVDRAIPAPCADSGAGQSLRPVRLVGAPASAYDQQIVEYPGSGAASDNLQHSSYGRVLPFSVAPSVGAQPHLTTAPYSRVPISAPSPTAPLPTTPPSSVATLPTAPLPAPRPEPAPLRGQPAIQLAVSTGLDVGLSRKGKPNEDSLLALQNTRVLRGCSCPVGLFVVADGMGGHENGQEASRLVIQSLSKTVVPSIIYGPTDDNYAELLAEGVHHANLEVYQRNRQAKADMGTTIVAALVVDTTAYVVSAGDSRVYLYRSASGLSQVTRDHSTVARLVENGLIQPEDIYTHPRRNEIYRSLGHHPSEDLDKFILALQPEDILMLCSDGLWEMVRDSQIQQIIASTRQQPTQTSAALVQAALEGGGKDNISVIIVSVNAAQEANAAWAG